MKSNNYLTTSFNTNSDLSPSTSEYNNYQLQLSNIRVISKKIVYLIGIPIDIADEETLIKKEYLGQYGSIHKLIVNKNGYMKNESNFPTYSSYITYSNEIEASLALLSLNNSTILNYKLNACYGTNKYCNNFLKGVECNNIDCYYLHEFANKNDIIIKNDSLMKVQFIEQQKIATNIADIFSSKQKNIYIKKGLETKKEFEEKKIENYFPTIDTIYDKKCVQDLENENQDNNNDKSDYYNNKRFNKDYYYQPSSPDNVYSKKNKMNKFSSPQLDKYTDENSDKLIEDEEGNEEYILVRQPSRHKKKYGGNKNIYKRNYYKKSSKLKFTLEKYKIKYNIREENPISSCNSNAFNQNSLNELIEEKSENDKYKKISTETISGYNTNESSSLNNQQDEVDLKKSIYKNAKKSRFSFVSTDLESIDKKNTIIIPDFIKEILNKKLNSLNFTIFFRKTNNNNYMEEILLNEEIKIVNKWVNNN